MSLRRITPTAREALFDAATTRRIEQEWTAQLPPHTLMARAGHAVMRLARALHPHARRVWIACGPGNNGGDGLLAAALWQANKPADLALCVTLSADPDRLPTEARWALARAREAGVCLSDTPPESPDLIVDALLGLGGQTRPGDPLEPLRLRLRDSTAPVLCVDLPSGLDADTGHWSPAADTAGPRHTLSLLTLKPGLFTAQGRDAAGQVWLDDLDAPPGGHAPRAWLGGYGAPSRHKAAEPHAGHKGRYGDVAVLGGQLIGQDGRGMSGATLLSARCALHAGAGRVLLAFVGHGDSPTHDTDQPELMVRTPQALLDEASEGPAAWVVGCGGGAAIEPWLPNGLAAKGPLVLDADALNALARTPALAQALVQRTARGGPTVLTPHPLEAARLLAVPTVQVMGDRLGAAETLARQTGATVVLKGSGTVVAAPGQPTWINATGNASLATAGSGDVLAGWIGAALAGGGAPAFDRVCRAVAAHGALADAWSNGSTLTASALAARAHPV